MSTSRRYKQIKIKKMSGGEGQKFFSNIIKFFKSSEIQIDLKSKLIKLATKFASQTIASYQTEYYIPSSCYYNNYNYHLGVENSAGNIRLYKATGAGTFSTVYTFTAQNGLDEVHGLISFKDKLIALFWDDTAGENVQYYSTNPASAWTQITTLPNDQAFKGLLIIDNTLYLLFSESVYTSADGITFSQYYSSPDDILLKSFEFFKGFIYVSTYHSKSKNHILMKFENDDLMYIRRIKELSQILATDDFLYCFNSSFVNPVILRFDGDSFKKFFDFDDYDSKPANIAPLTVIDKKLYFLADWQTGVDKYYMYSIVNDVGVFLELSLSDDEFIRSAYEINDVLYIVATLDQEATKTTKIYNNSASKFEASGYIESSIIDEGEIMPKQLILRHKPLPASVSVKLYVKKDRASSWGSAVLTSDTDGAVKKKYDFPSGNIYDFIQFKIELLTTDETETPEDIDLTFLYKPIGLEVAN